MNMKNNSRSAFTLMELLLVVALLAVVAAIGAPTFFMNAGERIDQSRMAMFKARYATVRSALDMALKDESVLKTAYKVTGSGGSEKIDKLVESGHLPAGSTRFENRKGQELSFAIQSVPASPVELQLPPILRQSDLHVFVEGTSHDIDKLLKEDNKSWREIWEDINP